METLDQANTVRFDTLAEAIERFNRAGLNPFGPNIPVHGHSPLLLCLRGPGIDVEFPFHAADRNAETQAFLHKTPGFRTRHSVLYPMTRALVARQWHRVYAYSVAQAEVVDVKLLVNRRQDPELFARYPAASAEPWLAALKAMREPVIVED
jgi:hypothetical protein